MPTTESETDKREHVRKIINAARTGIFVTQRDGGVMHGRPMANADVEENFTSIWFGAQRSSAKVAEIRADDRVMIGYSNSGGTEWATVNGRARLVDDRAKIKALWSPFWKNWFEDPDDPELTLIEVTPEFAEYWDSGNKLVMLTKFAIGTLTGKDMTADDHKKVSLKR